MFFFTPSNKIGVSYVVNKITQKLAKAGLNKVQIVEFLKQNNIF